MKDQEYSVYVHKLEAENGPMYYAGVTTNVSRRWRPNEYLKSSLYPYIVEYGWESIEHSVIYKTYSKKKAYEMEDLLIRFYISIGKCINKQRSGFIYAGNEREYRREYQHSKYANDPEFVKRRRKRHREYLRKRRSTPEGKIYNRVSNFNHQHPDKAIETPKEARDKYLKNGYVPSYIKNNDL